MAGPNPPPPRNYGPMERWKKGSKKVFSLMARPLREEIFLYRPIILFFVCEYGTGTGGFFFGMYGTGIGECTVCTVFFF